MNTHTAPHKSNQMPTKDLPKEVTLTTGAGGFEYLHIDNAWAHATISLYGGQILSHHAKTQAHPLTFLSEQAHYQTGKSIKGGAPLCWPWFGIDTTGQERGAHGFARTRNWSLQSCVQHPNGSTHIILELFDSPETQQLWPHAFHLETSIIIGNNLHIGLTTHNRNEDPITISQALHTYFAVSDLEGIQVHGLEHTQYIDHAQDGHKQTKQQNGPVEFTQEVDRVYTHTPAQLSITDPQWQRQILIRSTGSHSTVVWNPGQTLCERSADLRDDAYRSFICVETANTAINTIIIQAGHSHTISAEYSIQALSNTTP